MIKRIKVLKYENEKNVIITIGYYPGKRRSLNIFNKENWDKYVARLKSMPLTNKAARDFKRLSLEPEYGFYYEAEVIEGYIELPQRHVKWLLEDCPEGEVKVHDYHTYLREKENREMPLDAERLLVIAE